MAAVTHGTAHLYGIAGTITNATVIDEKFDEACQNMAQTGNESGNEIERRYDDLHEEGTITIRIRTLYAKPTVGQTLTYNTVTYEITGIGRQSTQKGHRTIELKVKKSEFISYE